MGLTEFESHLQVSFWNLIKPIGNHSKFGMVKVIIMISVLINIVASGIDNVLFIVYAVLFGGT